MGEETTTDLPPDLAQARAFGRYQIISPIAAGGMGEVFLAKAIGAAGFEKKVVIKRIRPHLAQDPAFVRRFIREGRIVVQLSHPNVAQVFDMGQAEGTYFIAMEYVDGCDLRELIRRTGVTERPISTGSALFVLSSIADGLAHAHARKDDEGAHAGIIHRDVSPSNIMLSRDGAVKLVDFGVAKTRALQDESIGGGIRGKLQYMSPEQAHGTQLTGRSDVFALGVVAYELLSGKRPFDADTDVAVIDRVRFHDPTPIETCVKDVPEALCALVTRALSKEPSERPTAAEFCRETVSLLYESGETREDFSAFVREQLEADVEESLSLDDALLKALDQPAVEPDTGSRPGAGTATIAPDLPPLFAGDEISLSRIITPSSIQGGEMTSTVASPAASMATLKRLVGILVALVVVLLGVNIMLIDETRTEGTPPPIPEQSGVEASSTSSSSQTTNVGLEVPARVEPLEEMVVVRRAFEGTRGPASTAVVETKIIVIKTHPPHARISVGEKPMGIAPVELEVPVGEVKEGTAKLAGHRTVRFEVSFADGSPKQINLRALAKGTVHFRFRPADATVVLDGQLLKGLKNNVVLRELSVGKHTITVTAKGPDGTKKTKTEKFEIKTDEQKELGTLEP